MVDETLKREIKKMCGNGNREAKFKTLGKLRAARRDLSTPRVMTELNECIKKHGRASVAICVAATLYCRRNEINGWNLEWAKEILDCWITKTQSHVEEVCIDDGLNAVRICEYSKSFIELTTY